MHEILKFLSPIVLRTPGAGIRGAYVFRQGSVYAANQAMRAGVLLPSPVDFAVPAAELDAALARMPEVTGLSVEGDSVIIKGGRLKTSIELCQDEPEDPPADPDEWLPSPPGLCAALGLAVPFCGDRHWSAGVRLLGDRVTALANAGGIDVTVPGLGAERVIMLPAETATLLSAQGDPAEYGTCGENAVTFRWDDGRWLRAQLLTVSMPNVDHIFDKAGTKNPIPIDAECRAAYEDAKAMSDGFVIVSPAGFQGRKGAGRTLVEHPMKVKEESNWSIKELSAVMACASAWNPGGYPEPCAFMGNGLRGVVLGRAR